MLGIMRRIGALSLASGCSFCIRWIPSEYNVADGPSRGRGEPSLPTAVILKEGLCKTPKYKGSLDPEEDDPPQGPHQGRLRRDPGEEEPEPHSDPDQDQHGPALHGSQERGQHEHTHEEVGEKVVEEEER
eukprot:5491598-Pyramimonas_sp.AAC.1